MENATKPVPAGGTATQKEKNSFVIACEALIGSGLLDSLSEIDTDQILRNLTYERIDFQENDRLIIRNEPMDSFLILYEGILVIQKSVGRILIESRPSQNLPIIGLVECCSEKKISEFDLYGGSEGIAVKYNLQSLRDMKRIAPYSRLQLLDNIGAYLSSALIRQSECFFSLPTHILDQQILVYLLNKEEMNEGSTLNMSQFVGIKKYLGITRAAFSERLVRLKRKGFLL